jgi:hypothetical protein
MLQAHRRLGVAFSPWGEGAPKGRMRGPVVARHAVAPHQFGRMTCGRAGSGSSGAREKHATASHGLTSSPPWGEEVGAKIRAEVL